MNFIRQTFKNAYSFTSGLSRLSRRIFSHNSNNGSTYNNLPAVIDTYRYSMEPMNNIIKKISPPLFAVSTINFTSIHYPEIYGLKLLNDIKTPSYPDVFDNYEFNTFSYSRLRVEGKYAKTNIEKLFKIKLNHVGKITNICKDGGNISISHVNNNKFLIVFDSTTNLQNLLNIKKNLSAQSDVSEPSNKIVFNIKGKKTRKMLESLFKTQLNTRAFPHLTSKKTFINGKEVTIIRPSFIYERGWELYIDCNDAKYLKNELNSICKKYNIKFKGYNYANRLKINNGYGLWDENLLDSSKTNSSTNILSNHINHECLDNKYLIYSYTSIDDRSI